MSSTTAPIYLDHAAATTLEPDALEAMLEAARLEPAHPSASHAPGRRLRARIERSRAQVAEYLGCDATELRFERSGADALAAGIEAALRRSTGAVVSTHLEHPFVRDELARQARAGREIRWLPTPGGELRLSECGALFEGASVIVLTKLQHELGTVVDFEPLWSLAPNAYWVIDAVQAAAWLELESLYRDRVFVAASSYKLGGPPGAAALRVPPAMLQAPPSGEQLPENTERALDWIALAGFGGACEARVGRRDAVRDRAARLGCRLYEGLMASRGGGARNGEDSWLGPILSVSFPDLAGREIEHILDLEQVSISRTSACRQRFDEGSRIVAAAYPDEPWRAVGATRWSIGWSTTEAEVDMAIARFAARFGST